jgi:hypothetical protein
MKEIRIEGLNTRQLELLDMMWELESKEELNEWISTLEYDEVREVLVLKELLLAHCFDEVNDTEIAKDYLKKFRL